MYRIIIIINNDNGLFEKFIINKLNQRDSNSIRAWSSIKQKWNSMELNKENLYIWKCKYELNEILDTGALNFDQVSSPMDPIWIYII